MSVIDWIVVILGAVALTVAWNFACWAERQLGEAKAILERALDNTRAVHAAEVRIDTTVADAKAHVAEAIRNALLYRSDDV